ncbi:hypothetical protein LF933_21705, partial [Pectobacterium polaris]|nr:hypothetical protein [Pectobacterium polaris]
MSEITPNDLPPINELDEYTSHIPELQIDTDVLAGTGGPANFQAQALANRTKHLKRVLDAVSQQLTGISQAVAAAQQSADASMKKLANGSDIANPATFRANIGLGSAATQDAQTSSTDATLNRVLKLAANAQGSFGLGGAAQSPVTQRGQLLSYSASALALSEIGINAVGGGFQSGYNTNRRAQLFISSDGVVRARWSLSESATDTTTPWRLVWDNANLANPMTLDTTQIVGGAKTFTANISCRANNATLGLESLQTNESNVGRWVQVANTGVAFRFYIRAGNNNFPISSGERVITMPTAATGTILVTGNNAVADSGGFWKTA